MERNGQETTIAKTREGGTNDHGPKTNKRRESRKLGVGGIPGAPSWGAVETRQSCSPAVIHSVTHVFYAAPLDNVVVRRRVEKEEMSVRFRLFGRLEPDQESHMLIVPRLSETGGHLYDDTRSPACRRRIYKFRLPTLLKRTRAPRAPVIRVLVIRPSFLPFIEIAPS